MTLQTIEQAVEEVAKDKSQIRYQMYLAEQFQKTHKSKKNNNKIYNNKKNEKSCKT